MLSASNVRFARGDREILRGVSLALTPGELVAVIGPNGAGKSTLLQLLSGALAARGGAVTLDGAPLNRWCRQALARRRAVLSQTATLGFPFRVLDVVLLGRSPHAGRAARRDDLQVAEAAMRETGILHLADRVYTTLSGGERQRVQLARALAQIWPAPDEEGGRYLLLDEPTNNLDLAHQHAILQIGRRLAGRGTGVLAILHDPNLAALHADRIAVLKDGAILIDGLPDTVLTETTLAAAFGLAVTVRRHPTRDCPYVVPA
jgi:iron complex transport system ATP-binding protein